MPWLMRSLELRQ